MCIRDSGNGAAVGHQCGSILAAAKALTQREIARIRRGAGEDEVAEACQTGERFGLRAARQAETRHFGKAAADQRRARVEAKSGAVDDAARDREDILDLSLIHI